MCIFNAKKYIDVAAVAAVATAVANKQQQRQQEKAAATATMTSTTTMTSLTKQKKPSYQIHQHSVRFMSIYGTVLFDFLFYFVFTAHFHTYIRISRTYRG